DRRAAAAVGEHGLDVMPLRDESLLRISQRVGLAYETAGRRDRGVEYCRHRIHHARPFAPPQKNPESCTMRGPVLGRGSCATRDCADMAAWSMSRRPLTRSICARVSAPLLATGGIGTILPFTSWAPGGNGPPSASIVTGGRGSTGLSDDGAGG